jgi:hypothetical protein
MSILKLLGISLVTRPVILVVARSKSAPLSQKLLQPVRQRSD